MAGKKYSNQSAKVSSFITGKVRRRKKVVQEARDFASKKRKKKVSRFTKGKVHSTLRDRARAFESDQAKFNKFVISLFKKLGG